LFTTTEAFGSDGVTFIVSDSPDDTTWIFDVLSEYRACLTVPTSVSCEKGEEKKKKKEKRNQELLLGLK